jgi:hypothetical protein
LVNVRFTPNSGHWNSVAKCPLWAKSCPEQAQQKSAIDGSLFDHLVGACYQLWRHIEPERFGSLGVDEQFELRRLLHGRSAGFSPLSI